MVKIVARVLFFVLLATSANAQNSTWVIANPDCGVNINFMSFPSHDTGYFAGVGSVPFIMNTIDSGHDVSNQQFPDSVKVGGNSVLDMSWPTSSIGYISCGKGLLKTINGGKAWTVVQSSPTLLLSNISFPSPNVGYASVDSDTKFFIAKTVNGGVDWTKVYQTPYQPGRIYFKDDTHGIFFAADLNASRQYVGYTMNGMTTTTMSSALNGTGALPWFLSWNDDNSWNVGYLGIQRSTDSGKTWKQSWDASKDTNVLTACYKGKRGFAFTDMRAQVLESTDTGATYIASILPDSIGPVASAITTGAAYVVGVDFSGHDVLLRADLPVAPSSGGGVSWSDQPITPFTVYVDGQLVTFTAAAGTTPRTIDILDVLGRSCSSLPLPSNTEMARVSRNVLRPGTYFARLGNSFTKFTITN